MDAPGQVMLAATGDRALPNAEWEQGRILLSTRRLVLATADERETIPLETIQRIGGRIDTSIDARQVSEYVTVCLPERTYLVTTRNHDRFERSLFRALLHGQSTLAKHPAVEGGVVTDQDWQPARLTIDDHGLAIALKSGNFVHLALNELSGLEADTRSIDGDRHLVVAASHVSDSGTIVETHLAGRRPTGEHLHRFLKRGMTATETNVDLSETERAVLMALYSGISPFDIPAFLDRDVDRVEEIYDRLLALNLVEEVRRRREVQLNARGRNLAGAVSQDQ